MRFAPNRFLPKIYKEVTMRRIVTGADVLPIQTFVDIILPLINGIEEVQGGWQVRHPDSTWMWFPICLDHNNNEVVLIDGCLE